MELLLLQGRGAATGYDTAVALPAAGDAEELEKENLKSAKALKGQAVFSIAKVPGSFLPSLWPQLGCVWRTIPRLLAARAAGGCARCHASLTAGGCMARTLRSGAPWAQCATAARPSWPPFPSGGASPRPDCLLLPHPTPAG